MVKAAQTANKVSFGDVFTFLGSYELVLYIIIILGAFWILLAYDRHVIRAMGHVSKEIKAGMVVSFNKKNHLGRESLWLAGILGFSVALSVVELFAGDSILANIASFVKPIEIFYKGSSVISIAVVAVMAVKYFLVSRCSADFDRLH